MFCLVSQECRNAVITFRQHTLKFCGAIVNSRVLDLAVALHCSVAVCCFHFEAAVKLFICPSSVKHLSFVVLSEDDGKMGTFLFL